MKLMIEPLSKRFHYHFYGAKQTNSLDKVSLTLVAEIRGWEQYVLLLEAECLPFTDHQNRNPPTSVMTKRGL